MQTTTRYIEGLKRALVGVAAMAMVTLGASEQAWADGELVIIFTPGALTTTTTGVVITVTDSVSTSTSSTTERIFDCAQAELYLQHNQVGLSQGIAMGGGEHVGDLARMARIDAEDEAAFAALLRAERATLLPILRAEIDADATEAFVAAVEEAMRQDARLARYVI